MNKSSNPIDENYTETSVEQFKDFMKFIGDNNLWDEVEQHLKENGIANVVVSSRPIESIRRLITDKLLKDGRLGRQAHAQAVVIARCHCGGGGGSAPPDGGSPAPAPGGSPPSPPVPDGGHPQ